MATKLMARLALAVVTGALLFVPTGAGAQSEPNPRSSSARPSAAGPIE